MDQLTGLQEFQQLLGKASQVETTYVSSIEQFTRTLFARLDTPDVTKETHLALLFQGIHELANHMFNAGIIVGHGLTSLGLGDVAVGIVTGEINLNGGESIE